MPGMAWESGEVQWISNLGEMDPVKFPRATVCKEAGIKFAFGIPYFIGDTCNDVIEVFSELANSENTSITSLHVSPIKYGIPNANLMPASLQTVARGNFTGSISPKLLIH